MRAGTASSSTWPWTGLHLVMHLARGGWLQWRESLPPAPPRPGEGPARVPAASRPASDDEPVCGFDLTEAGTQKRLAVYLVHDPLDVPGIARLGPDALSVDVATARRSAARRSSAQLKGALTDQTVLAGIGNAYSDEILHTARLSPFKIAAKLTEDEVATLHAAIGSVLTDAVERSVGQRAATLKGGETQWPAGARPVWSAVPGVRRHGAYRLVRG